MFLKELSLGERIFRGEKFDFLVLERDEVKNFYPNSSSIIISITDPENTEAHLPNSEKVLNTMRLKFHDIGSSQARNDENNSDISFSEENARQILEFIQRNKNCRLIICQCEQGISRSAAVAAALSKYLQGEDDFFFKNYWPNRYVYEVLTKVLTDSVRKIEKSKQ